jgi:endonuclease/exonuclease/phosphatase family metal-dependent hydrolase
VSRFVFLIFFFLFPVLSRGLALARQQPPESLLLISEVDVNPPGRDEAGEWVELVYLGPDPLPLADYKVGDEEQLGGSGEGMFRFPEDASAEPGQVLVIARNATAFRGRFGFQPSFEFYDGDPSVPDMRPYRVWASGDLFLANDGDELLLASPDNVILDAINWGDSQRFFVPALPVPASGQSLARAPAFCDSDSAVDWLLLDRPAPGVAELTGDCPEPAVLAPSPATSPVELTGPISAIQGDGDVSPYLDQFVTFRGLVTGVHENRNARGAIFYTLFVQDDPAQADGNPATSDAIAVFTATARPSFLPGDLIQVRGRVSEFYGLTEIDFRDLEIVSLGRSGTVLPVTTLSSLVQSSLEPFESMLVTLPEVRVAGPTHTGCGFAVAALDTPLPQLHEDPLGPVPPVLPVLHRSNITCTGFPDVKRGDLIRGVSGPLTYRFDQYQIVQQELGELHVIPAPLPIPTPLAPAGPTTFSIVTVNIQDYLAADPALLTRQEKVVDLFASFLSCPAIIAIQEVENAALLREIATGLGRRCETAYVIAHRDSADARGIDVALLADAGRIQVTTIRLHQGCTALETGIADPSVRCPAGHSPLHSRPPLQVDVEVEDVPYTFFVNHLKSKREGEVETAQWRQAQATHLVTLVTQQLDVAPDSAVVVLGDFNDLPESAAMQTLLTGAPLVDPLRRLPAEIRYTYVFAGLAEMLDTILLSPAAAAALIDSGIVHMNADYPSAWLADLTVPFHATDHDVPWVLMRLPEEAAPAGSNTPARILPATMPEPVTGAPTSVPRGPAPVEKANGTGLVIAASAGALGVLVLLLVLRRFRS